MPERRFPPPQALRSAWRITEKRPHPVGGVIGPASPIAWGAHRWATPNPLSQSQAQPLSLWSLPAAGVLCLCRPALAEGAAGAAAEAWYSAASADPALTTVKPDGAFTT